MIIGLFEPYDSIGSAVAFLLFCADAAIVSEVIYARTLMCSRRRAQVHAPASNCAQALTKLRTEHSHIDVTVRASVSPCPLVHGVSAAESPVSEAPQFLLELPNGYRVPLSWQDVAHLCRLFMHEHRFYWVETTSSRFMKSHFQ